MKPIGYISESGKDRLASRAHWYCLSVSKTNENEFTIPIYDTALEAAGVRELVEALETIVDEYVYAVNSNLSALRNPDKDDVVIAARTALARYRGSQ